MTSHSAVGSAQKDRAATIRSWKRRARRLTPYLFILPKIAIFAAFLLYPLVQAVLLSFKGGAILSGMRNVGFANYRKILDDDLFWIGLRNTAWYTVLVIPAVIGAGIGLAALLNQQIRFRGVFIALLIVPSVASTVAASLIWNYLLQTNGGLFNAALGLFGVAPVNWLGTPKYLMPIFVAVEVWRGAGFYAIIFLASMQSIPSHLYDAAAIDGATASQSFRLITLPLMRPALLFSTVMATIWNFQLFDSPYVMTKGGPGHASLTIVMYIYDRAFKYDSMGMAATMSIVLLLIIMCLALLQLRLFHKEIQF